MNYALIYALIAVLSWSTVATAFKITLQYLSHTEMVLVASATATLIFAVAITLSSAWKQVATLSFRNWATLALLGVLNPVAYYLVLFKAYDLLPAHVAQPINYTWPIVLLVMLAVFGGQRIPLRKYAGLLLSLGGVVLISSGGSHGDAPLPLSGIALAFLSALLWATYWVANRKTDSRINGTVALFISFLCGTIYALIGVLATGGMSSGIPAEGYLAGMYVGAFEMGIPFIFFAMALRTTSNPALVNQLTYLSPFLSLFLIAVILGETITMLTVVGLILIVSGIVLNEATSKHKN